MANSIPKFITKIEAFGDRVFVMLVENEKVTKSGIVIPDTASEKKAQEGVVIALGDGKVRYEGKELSNPQNFLKVGDKVLFGKYAGDDLVFKTTDGKDVEVKVLRLDSVLGKVGS